MILFQPPLAFPPPALPPFSAPNAAQENTLTLQAVLDSVGTRYPKVLGASAERQAAAAKQREKRGAFDVTTTVGGDFNRYNSASSRGKEYTATTTSAAVETTLRSGLKISAGREFNAGVVKSPASSTGSQGTYFASAKLPLLRGRNLNDKLVGEQQAALGVAIADFNISTVRLSALFQAANAYWDWAGARQKQTVAADLLRLAEVRAAQIRRENELGVQADIALVEAEQEVQKRRGSLTKAERDVQKAAIKLALYLWNPDGTPAQVPDAGAAPPVIPAPVPVSPEAIAEARERARNERPEIAAVGVQQNSAGLDLRLAQNDTLPDVSLTLQPGQDLGRRGVGETMKAGIFFSLPLNRWEATGRRDGAQAKQAKLQQERDLLTRQVALEVEDAASAMNTTYARYLAALEEVRLAVRLGEGERIKFREGDSTLFLVNQRERSTAEARARLIDVMAEYQQAKAAFDTASVQIGNDF